MKDICIVLDTKVVNMLEIIKISGSIYGEVGRCMHISQMNGNEQLSAGQLELNRIKSTSRSISNSTQKSGMSSDIRWDHKQQQ